MNTNVPTFSNYQHFARLFFSFSLFASTFFSSGVFYGKYKLCHFILKYFSLHEEEDIVLLIVPYQMTTDQQLQTMHFYYFTIYEGQDFRHSLEIVSASGFLQFRVCWPGLGFHVQYFLEKNLLPSLCVCWQDLVLWKLLAKVALSSLLHGPLCHGVFASSKLVFSSWCSQFQCLEEGVCVFPPPTPQHQTVLKDKQGVQKFNSNKTKQNKSLQKTKTNLKVKKNNQNI